MRIVEGEAEAVTVLLNHAANVVVSSLLDDVIMLQQRLQQEIT
jgi:hypothetical protein